MVPVLLQDERPLMRRSPHGAHDIHRRHPSMSGCYQHISQAGQGFPVLQNAVLIYFVGELVNACHAKHIGKSQLKVWVELQARADGFNHACKVHQHRRGSLDMGARATDRATL